MEEALTKCAVFPGIGDALRRLAAGGVQLAVVSSNSRENVERVIGTENAKLMAHSACGVSMFGKAAKLRQVVRQSAMPPQHVIYIGDEIRDSEAAGKAGIAFGAVLWGQHSQAALRAQKPAEIFK